MIASTIDWQELHEDESPPIAPQEILDLVPASHTSSGTRCLVILPDTIFESMMRHLKGDCTVERIGILAGRPYTHPSNRQLLVCIDAALPVDDADATNVHVSIQKNMWKSLWAELPLADESRIVGWYHSHPKHGVFLSPIDLKTQSLWFAQEWKIAIVVDPIRDEYQLFTGADGTPTPLILTYR
jgi:proteasome lid subunit RPN8/RPN11